MSLVSCCRAMFSACSLSSSVALGSGGCAAAGAAAAGAGGGVVAAAGGWAGAASWKATRITFSVAALLSFSPRVASALPGSSCKAFWKNVWATELAPWARAWRPRSFNWVASGGPSSPRATTPDSNTPPSVNSPAPFHSRAIRDMFDALQQKGQPAGSPAWVLDALSH